MKGKYLLSGLFFCLLWTSVAKAESIEGFDSLNPWLDSNQKNLNSDRHSHPFHHFSSSENFRVATETNWTDLLEFNNNRLSSIEPLEHQQSLITAQLSQTAPITTNRSSVPTTPSSTTSAEAEFLNYQTTAESLSETRAPNLPLAQVNNVSQLRDVAPGDWAYEALRSLVERYGCIAGFPDRTYRGKEALSRYEFAAGLNSCLQQIERLIAASETVAREDLETAKRLSEEFETELIAIAGKIDNLEGRVAFLEDNQFSTTTILNGEVIFALADAFGGGPPGGCEQLELNPQSVDETTNVVNCGLQNVANPGSTADDPDTNTVFAYFARLGLQASFSGQDRLRMFLTTGNFDNGGFTNPESLNTYSPRFSYQAGLENEVFLDILEYRVPAFNDRVAFYASTFGFALSNVLTSNSPYFDIGRGSVSRFGQLNPIFRIGGAMDAGVGFDWLIADPLRLQVAYGTRDSGDPEAGFFGSDFSTLGVQFLAQPTDNIVTGITYVNAYSSDGSLGTFTGSVNAETNGLWSGGRLPNPPTDDLPGGAFPGVGVDLGDFPAQINAVGGTFQWNLTQNLNFGASVAYTFTNYLDEIPEFGLDGQIEALGFKTFAGEKPFANTLTYQFSLGYSDPFGREGDLFGFIFGMPPKLVDAGPVTPGQTVPFSEQVINNEDAVTVTDNDPRNFLTRNDELGDPNNGNLIQEGTLDQFGREDEATSLHFEFFYRFKVNDFVSITPGFFFVTNPGHIEDNDTLYVGTLRTTFRF